MAGDVWETTHRFCFLRYAYIKSRMFDGIAYLSIAVSDMNVVQNLWIDELGLAIIARRQGPDEELGRLWGLPAEQFADQLLLATPGASTGYLHFVQLNEPGESVRLNAASTDLGAKNIDVNCTGMPALVERLKAAGYSFRSEIGAYEIDGIQAREVQMPVHDGINVVLIEVLSEGFEVDYTNKGFAALTSFVVVVPDVVREAEFYRALFGFQQILRHELSGPALEMAAALPKGTVLDLHLLGHPAYMFGRMELIEYKGVHGANRFERAVPPATGILRCGFKVDSLDEFIALAEKQGVGITRSLQIDAIFGKGQMIELRSPAGLELQILASEGGN
jgi:catechol 2,3-dioxygenase-like lactoylglutathione lyase family enzyme